MASSKKKKGLGKGLGALISMAPSAAADGRAAEPSAADPGGTTLLDLNPRDLRPNPSQPRREFPEASLHELAESIRMDGVLEPIVVRQVKDGYELVSGERRVRASILAELKTIPAVVREVSDSDMLKLGIIENVQREDLNPIELARAYQELADLFTWTQEEVAKQVGKKRATVTNTMRLLNLPEDVQQRVISKEITHGHARALLALETHAEQSKACFEVIRKGLSVRQTEKLATATPVEKSPKAASTPDPHITTVEDELRRRFGTKVRISANAEYKGKFELDFHNLDEFERILALLRS